MARPSPDQADIDISSQLGESKGFSGELMCKSICVHLFSPEKSTMPRRWEQVHLSTWQLSWKIMQLASNTARDKKKTRIISRYLQLAIR